MAKWTPCKGFWASRGLPEPFSEYKLSHDRRWRLDFAWPYVKVAIEIEGGIFSFGRHTRGLGFFNDMAKMNMAQRLGWDVYRFTPEQLDKNMEIERYPKTYKGKREIVSEFLGSVLK